MYTEPLICAELELSGFKIIKTTTFYGFPAYYAIKKLLAKALLRRHCKPNNILILAQKA
jgi:hypothetical protein